MMLDLETVKRLMKRNSFVFLTTLDLLFLTICIQSASASEKHVPGVPFIVNLKYNADEGQCVALYDVVRDFSAPVNNPDKDCSGSIQRAIDAVHEAGGGVVYIPEGIYNIRKPLTVRSGVTLRGEWQSPEQFAPGGSGTILVVNTGDITASPAPFITLMVGGGVRGLTIIYPESAKGRNITYSATIAQESRHGCNSYTVREVTILGGTIGFDASTGRSELHYLKNVYISSLGFGIKINDVSDIGRLENVHISPEFLVENTLFPVDSGKATSIRKFCIENTIGLYMQRSDWEYIYDLDISGVCRGIVLERYLDPQENNRSRGSNGQMFNVNLYNCKVAIDVDYVNAIGYALTNVVVRDCERGIQFGQDFMSCFELTNLSMEGTIPAPIFMNSAKGGRLTITNSKFSCRHFDEYAVTVNQGSVSLQQCEFSQGSKHLLANSLAGSISVLGCEFNGVPDIKTKCEVKNVLIDHTQLHLPKLKHVHTYRPTIPMAGSSILYNVADYGAVNGKDATKAFKAALEAARHTGGIVYVPSGEFFVNEPLIIPSGVELRGVVDVPTHSVTRGSTICTDHGRNNTNSQPFISLEENAGIYGINFFYPEQNYLNPSPYPWTVRNLGRNCWIVNSIFINSYKAVDFGTNPSDGHYINYVGGAPLKCGLFIGNNNSDGWIENVQFNPHYWSRARLACMKVRPDPYALNETIYKSSQAMVFGYNAFEHVLNTFAYASNELLVFKAQNGKATSGVFIGHGSDGCANGLVVEEIDDVVMANAELVTMKVANAVAPADKRHIIWMKKSVTGKLTMFNTQAWDSNDSAFDTAILVESGHLNLAQLFFWNMQLNTHNVTVTDGLLKMSTAIIPWKKESIILRGKGKIELKGVFERHSSSYLTRISTQQEK